MRAVFLSAITLLLAVIIGFSFRPDGLGLLGLLLLGFFSAFNVLEASLPSLVSRLAPPASKGSALGVYNTAQSLGLFTGGAMAGWVLGRFGPASVFEACAALLLFWLVVALGHRRWPRRRAPAAQSV